MQNPLVWSDSLDRFNLLSSQFYNLLYELTPELKNEAIFPIKTLPDPNIIPNVFMRTRLIPEIEDYHKELEMVDDSVKDDEAFERLVEEHDDVCKKLIMAFDELSDEYHLQDRGKVDIKTSVNKEEPDERLLDILKYMNTGGVE
ncbi:hypothetical protein O9G_003196 [Rozella allomycis CSF55]|uniref:Mediator of RNA polymerase II transcription subunit 8 n=1 Tax=Rozella allomycis (strain CSF55) TaxID=988480 RepID=A0A075AXH4_ROZAC|nr:hypothetical protein O9G_003196 [Rozella allomycis CSF55]|eukprot:EPZ35010.1 hypothetical protein O9G_003196 [Rozella allomycis CSF55]